MHPEFTLTELLVVTATIGVVGAAVLTGAGGQNTRVDKAVFKSDLRSAAMTAVQNSLNLENPRDLCLSDESLRNILHKIFTDAGAENTHFLTAPSGGLNAHFIAEYPNGTFVTETGTLKRRRRLRDNHHPRLRLRPKRLGAMGQTLRKPRNLRLP